MKTIELNEELNKFEWGYVEKEKNIVNADKFLHYKTLSPEKFIEKKCGICWDYVNFEATWLINNKMKCTMEDLIDNTFSQYQIQSNIMIKNHTWIAYMKNKKVYLFESAWKHLTGIKKFNTEQEMMEYYYNVFIRDYNVSKAIIKKYPLFVNYDLSPIEFFNYINEKGKIVFSG